MYLKQIVEYVSVIEDYVGGVKYIEFEKNGLLQDAVIRKIELIGEEARKLGPLFWNKYRKTLPLAEAVSTQNRLIHEYDDIDLKIIWNTVKEDLPTLKLKIKKLI